MILDSDLYQFQVREQQYQQQIRDLTKRVAVLENTLHCIRGWAEMSVPELNEREVFAIWCTLALGDRP